MSGLLSKRLSHRLRFLFAVLIASTLALFFLAVPSFAHQSVLDAVQGEDDGEDWITIGSIQGDGRNSPFLNETVSFRGIVTGHYEDVNADGIVFYTLFVQDRPEEADGDPATSDGIAVFLGRQQPTADLGDEVAVTGRITEFYGLSEVEDDGLELRVLSRDNPLPPPVALDAWPANAENYEALEGMRVSLDGARVVAPTYGGCGFFVVRPTFDGRPLRQHVDDPLDDVVPVLHESDVSCDGFPQIKVGDQVSGMAGPLHYHFDQFKIVQQDVAALEVVEGPLERPTSPPSAGSETFSVASFNLENYFDTVSDTGRDAEPVSTAEELATKQTKLAAAIGDYLLCPTLLGVQEVENEPLLRELVAQLEAACGFTYRISHRESVDARGIDVALLSDPDRVAVGQVALRQGCGTLDTDVADPEGVCPMGQDPLFSRPPLQVDVTVDGTPYTVFVNHFKSKSGGESITEPRRRAQAAHQRALVDEVLAADADAGLIVLGDLNDYALSAPLQTLTEDGGLVNVLMELPEEERYSYTFSGAAQLLDYVLLSPAVADEVAWVGIVHMNADYPAAWAQDRAVAYRVSDHDIPMVLLRLPAEEEAVAAERPTPAATEEGGAMVETTPESQEASSPAAAEGQWTIVLVVAAAVALVAVVAVSVWALRGR